MFNSIEKSETRTEIAYTAISSYNLESIQKNGEGNMMRFIKNKVVMVILLITMTLNLGLPGIAVAAEESRIVDSKGKGAFSLAQRWEKRFVSKEVYRYEQGKEVVGFYTKDWVNDNVSHSSLKENSESITGIATFTYKVDTQGNLIGTVPREALKISRKKDIEALALIHNLSSSGFNRQLIHSILTDSDLRAKTISNIYKTLIKQGYDGVNIDFENVSPKDREALSIFMEELGVKLSRDGLKVTMSVPAKTWDSPTNEWSGAFDYNRLSNAVDRLMLMTYDEHWLGGSPGPVASQQWVEKVVNYSTTVAPKEKLLLGVGNYGYDWIVGKGGHKSVPAKKATSLAADYSSEIQWDDASQTPYFNYWKDRMKHVVWFESTHSAARKLDLVNQYNLKGIAIWKLGFELPSFWDMIWGKFQKAEK